MFEWLICAAGIVTQVATDPGAAAIEAAPTDFLEFLAEWDQSESMALDSDEPPADGEPLNARVEERSSRPSSPVGGTEVLR